MIVIMFYVCVAYSCVNDSLVLYFVPGGLFVRFAVLEIDNVSYTL